MNKYDLKEMRDQKGITPQEAMSWYEMMPKTADGYVPILNMWVWCPQRDGGGVYSISSTVTGILLDGEDEVILELDAGTSCERVVPVSSVYMFNENIPEDWSK